MSKPRILTPLLHAIVLTAGCAPRVVVKTVEVTVPPAPTATPAPAATVAGSTIQVTNSIHTEAGITVKEDLTIEGQGATDTIVQAHAGPNTAADRVFVITEGASVMIRGMTIRHGNVRAPSGADGVDEEDLAAGGIWNEGTLTLEDCVVSDNVAKHAGGILNKGVLELRNCTVRDNTASSRATTPGIASSRPTSGPSCWAPSAGTPTTWSGIASATPQVG